MHIIVNSHDYCMANNVITWRYCCALLQTVSQEQITVSVPETAKQQSTDTSQPKMDFGMSKPEDKDMYTTRG